MIGYLLYSLIGSIAGFLAGLLGIGGGAIVVPGLAYTFNYLDMPQNAIMHMAASTSLATMILTTLTATLAQHRRKTINWPVFRNLAPTICLGTIAGVSISSLLPSHTLKILFGLFMVSIAVRMLLQKKTLEPQTSHNLPNQFIQYGAGLVIGGLSGMLGIGGGALTIPILLQFGLSAHEAAGTSSVCALLLSITGTISFMIAGWYTHISIDGSTGYVFWPAAITIAITSIIWVPIGSKLASRLTGHALKRFFAVFLLLIGLDMLLR